MGDTIFVFEGNVVRKIILSSYNVFIQILMGMIVGITLLFAVKKEFNATSVPENIILLHIILCVLGYTLIMSQSIICLTSYNTWSLGISITNKWRVHWVLQVLGSMLALTGNITIIIYKDINFNTLHGKFGLVSLVFTTASVIIGIAALFSNKLRKYIPPILSKIVHIILGVVAYASASICLCYGFNKTMFKLWTSENVALGVIAFTTILTLMVLINPSITIFRRLITHF